MSTKVKFGLTYNSENWTEGKIYFNNGGDSNSLPLAERVYLNGKDYSGVKEIIGESESSGYIVGSLKVDNVYIKVNGWDDKVDKVSNPINGNLVTMTADGSLVNSNKKPSDFDEAGAASAVLGTSGDSSSLPTVYGVKNAVNNLRDLSLSKSQLGTVEGLSTPIIGTLYGIAGLDSTGKVPSSQLPSYVDDVVEVRGGFYDDGDIYCPSTLGSNYSGEDENFKKDATSSDFNATNKVKRSNLSDNIVIVNEPHGSNLSDNDNIVIVNKPHGTYYLDFITKKIYKCVPAGDGTTGGVWQVAFEGKDNLEGKIYVVINLSSKSYRYAGDSTGFVEIIASPGTLDEIAEGSINKHYTDAKANLKANKVVSNETIVGHIATLKSDGDIDDSGKSFVTTFSGTVSNNNVPTEKLVKDALDLKAPLASPSFTGAPTSTTPSTNDYSTKIATTAYVKDNLIDRIKYTGEEDAVLNNIALFGEPGVECSIKDGGYSITTTIETSASNYKIPTEKAVNDKLADISSTLNNLVWD